MHTKRALLFFTFCMGTIFFSPTDASSIFNEQTSAEAQHILDTLTLEQKIGQLFIVATVVDPASNDVLMQQMPYRVEQAYIEQLITENHIGGIIFLGTAKPEQQIALTNHYQALAKKVGAPPLLIVQDLEWGLSMRLKNVVRYPRNMALGEINDTRETDEQNLHSTTQQISQQSSASLIYEMAKEIGHQAKLLGVHMNLAPVMDVNNNPENPIINDRSFGAHPEIVARKACAYMRGLHDAGILSCAKHFPGHGDTRIDSHHDLPCIAHTKKRLNEIELTPFKAAIAADIPAIMIAHLHMPAYEKKLHTPA
ncbi:MAG: glycoside hydrolase family 3 N-terminal domain-containing protein, partial [Hydrogenophaga sp.]|nr:glycoside hydrolase family 3 N-terminal domain-containing protein [Hydrogenophaga sp.]